MPCLIVHQNGISTEIKAKEGEILLDILRNHGYNVSAPCGGKGTCGKCEVMVKGMGNITSCIYKIDESIEIVLPYKREAIVLVARHDFTIDLPLLPGKSVEFSEFPHGVAVDIGTTSLVFYLVNLKTGAIIATMAILNPQAKYGADVISRIQYISENAKGLETLHIEIINAINLELSELIHLAGISKNDVVKMVLAGNTTMLHLLLGVSPASLALFPFRAQFLEEKILTGKELKLNCLPIAEIKILPSVSAFVGADIVAGLASIVPSSEYRTYLFMDIGTNGELALVTDKKIWCCSTAAGPAFEGAKIACGMGAIEGAISSFDKDGFYVIGGEKPSGICGSGLVDLIAYMVENGIISSDGLLENDYTVAESENTLNKKDIYLCPNDVREVQLAKAAIAAGLKILMKQAGIGFDKIDKLFLAGGFGNYINTENAIRIGLLPSELRDKIATLGNTSGTGAICALKSTQFDDVLQKLISKIIHVELANDDDFVMEFALNMAF
jgi:uncharacterized 2Fe-2S/4Fe-4S cluster protein (DUF4445 family)